MAQKWRPEKPAMSPVSLRLFPLTVSSTTPPSKPTPFASLGCAKEHQGKPKQRLWRLLGTMGNKVGMGTKGKVRTRNSRI